MARDLMNQLAGPGSAHDFTATLESVQKRLGGLETELMSEISAARGPQFGAKRIIEKMARQGGRCVASWKDNNGVPYDPHGGFKSFGHFLSGVAHHTLTKSNPTVQNWHDKTRNKALPSGFNETLLQDGATLVPPAFLNELLMRTYDNDLMSRVRLLPTVESNTLKIPAIDEVSRKNGSRFGGVTSYWRGEGDTDTASKAGFKQISLTVEGLIVLMRVTDELLADSTGIALEAFLSEIAGEEFAFRLGDAIINGDSVNKPQGLLKSGSKISVAKEAGQGAATVVFPNVVNMYARLHASCRKNSIFLINQEVEPQLFSMTLNGNLAYPVYLPPGGLSATPYGSLLGRPVLITEFNPQLGTEGDIILTDLSTYLMLTKGGIETAVSMHVYFLTHEQAFRFIMRVDGKSWWQKALTPYQGTTTQSNVITLATRA